jgi:glyoxylase-like metal-dependent hydrolase (beta-lactamase superfamily II)
MIIQAAGERKVFEIKTDRIEPHRDFMTVLNRQWQSVPGARQVRIYPYIRKPDVLSSNAFLLDAPDQIVLIDPGAQPEQSRELLSIVRILLHEHPRPVLICLTHCHIDHVLDAGLYYQFRKETPVWIAIHHDGADSLMSGDPRRTIAELYGMELPGLSPDILLLPPQVRKAVHSRNVDLPDQTSIHIRTEELKTTIHVPFYRKTIPLGGEDFLECYPTPGHSPDSVCLKAGRLLFLGDILAAVNPMVAGISGWNHQDFIHSATHLIWLLEQTDVAWCCPGHGGVIPAPLVIDLLKKMRSQAESLGEVEEMDARRLHNTAEFALEILEEAEEVFAAIAGRLYYLAYHLENLEEEQLALQYRQLLDTDQIDDCLRGLRLLADDLRAGQRLEVEFAHRALGIVQKIRTLFDQEKLHGVIPTILSNRAKLLLLDFINAAKGRRNIEDLVATDLNRLIEEILHDLKKSPHDDHAILDATDDETQFLSALAARIAYIPLFEDVKITFTPGKSLPLAHIVAARVADTLTDFLVLLAGRDCKEMGLSAAWEEGHGEICLLCPGKNIKDTVGEVKWKSFVRRFGMAGLRLIAEERRLYLKTDPLWRQTVPARP